MSSDNVPYIIAFFFLAFFVGYLIYGFYLLIEHTVKAIRDELVLKFQHTVNGSLKDDFEPYFANRFSYYDKFPEKLKVKFLLRVKNFISEKKFESREGLELTDEMKMWVAASAVQLTFGLSKYSLDHFEKIILYPADYYNSRTDAMHMGEANSRGYIVLSWKSLKAGFEDGQDTYNVGLHEMAHALELQLLLGGDYDFYFGNYYQKWSVFAAEEFEKMSTANKSFLREYAATNKREFFAVCVEYFFEASRELQQRLPQIYYHLCILLNQDPLASDTRVTPFKHKSLVELMIEIDSLTPVFISEYSFTKITFNIILTLFVFSVWIFEGFKGTLALLFISLFFGIFSLLVVLVQFNKIVLFDKYLVIKNVWGRVKGIYYLDEIVSVNFISGRGGESIVIKLAREGKIFKNSYSYTAKDATILGLREKLCEKKVLIR